VVQLLLEKGANINVEGGRFGNALRAASIGNEESIVRLLLNEGADINAQVEIYGDELRVAISRGRESVVQFLLKNASEDSEDSVYSGELED